MLLSAYSLDEGWFYKVFFPFLFMIRFSPREMKDLLKAWLAIAAAFALLYSVDLSRVSIFSGGLPFFSFSQFLLFFAISLFTVGVGFLFHELAHKIVAQKYGARAEFHSFDFMLILALVMSLFGFLLAAPGAVFIQGRLSRRQHGIVSAAGPLTNIVLAILFLLFIQVFGNNLFFRFGFSINAWLALFNMIPFIPFDGAKVLAWNKIAYFSAVALSLMLVLAGF